VADLTTDNENREKKKKGTWVTIRTAKDQMQMYAGMKCNAHTQNKKTVHK
jgi:hypothetical protein